MEAFRPWRKSAMQVVTLEIWKGLLVEKKDQEAVKEQEQEQEPEKGPEKGQEECDGEVLHQVGGHGAWDKSQAMQVSKDGLVLKPIQAGERGQREAAFYREISSSSDPSIGVFYEFVPQYFGLSRKMMEDGSKTEFLMMENLTKGYKLPCIMDVKIGARTWGPDASPAKQKQQDSSYASTKVPFGFSVPGVSVFLDTETEEGSKPEQVVHGKEYGRGLGQDNIDRLVPLFLAQDVRSAAAKLLAEIFVERLRRIQKLFQVQSTYHFFGSSILLVYDAAACENLTKPELNKSVVVKMIDFAHVWPAEGKLDQNYLTGVDSLIMLFEKTL